MVLPVPAGRQRELDAGTGGRHFAHQRHLPGVELQFLVGLVFQQRQTDAGVIDCAAVAQPGGGQDPPLGGQDVGAGVDGGVVAGVDAGAVAATQRRGLVFLGVGVGGQRNAVLRKGGRHDAVGYLRAAGMVGVTQHSLGLGADMINRPGGPGFGDGGDDRGGLLVYPGVGDCDMLGDSLIGDVGDHVGQGALAAEDFDGLGAPGVALLGQRAWFVFGLPGFQGGLLGQRKHFHHGGFAAVGDLELFGQLADAMLDRAAARGEFFIQFCWDADDFAHRPFARFGGHFGEAGAQFRDEQGLDCGCCKTPTPTTVAWCSGLPSSASQRGMPSAPMACTLLLITRWVCRLGSPARESR